MLFVHLLINVKRQEEDIYSIKWNRKDCARGEKREEEEEEGREEPGIASMIEGIAKRTEPVRRMTLILS